MNEKDENDMPEQTPPNTDTTPPASIGGYVYVIEFGSGTIKVGSTQNPVARLGQHRRDAEAFGTTVARRWLSPLHYGHRESEHGLKLIAARLSGVDSPKREYFTGVRFADNIVEAETLTFAPVTPEIVQQVEARAERTAGALFGVAETLQSTRTEPTGIELLPEVYALIERLFGATDRDPEGLPPGVPRIPMAEAERLSRMYGTPLSDLADLNPLQVLEQSVVMACRKHALDAEHRAGMAGRVDLLDPIFE